MKKLPTKPEPNNLGSPQDWMLPTIHLPHQIIPEAKKYAVGENHMLTVKAKKVSETEKGSMYKVTHVHVHPKKASKRYPLKH